MLLRKKKLVDSNRSTRRHIPEDCTLSLWQHQISGKPNVWSAGVSDRLLCKYVISAER